MVSSIFSCLCFVHAKMLHFFYIQILTFEIQNVVFISKLKGQKVLKKLSRLNFRVKNVKIGHCLLKKNANCVKKWLMTPKIPNQCNPSIDYFVIFDCGLFIPTTALPHTFKEKLQQAEHISAFLSGYIGSWKHLGEKKQKTLRQCV